MLFKFLASSIRGLKPQRLKWSPQIGKDVHVVWTALLDSDVIVGHIVFARMQSKIAIFSSPDIWHKGYKDRAKFSYDTRPSTTNNSKILTLTFELRNLTFNDSGTYFIYVSTTKMHVQYATINFTVSGN